MTDNAKQTQKQGFEQAEHTPPSDVPWKDDEGEGYDDSGLDD